ncbi:hypothetical protein A2960_04275 [Candidatus Gottesmanbacteria bacterium RIFCSPLOWO2_01_FULL_39_12b]|uniref:Type II secretion system protein GspF domain-containing protein n=1 Tax=Candidatus Gottesmanbacteria bacterium RIFCSPLOWO2_01_FULL_39_12b TaxID=1798388 RepID=A0A1F6AS18_9BACT|nr:MAG: hypothetical protein A2960_04275 [Candidatus Gottesmanbacteria bacterium RIFCSPLOWO2_01_FULL_39_12b]
MNTENITLSGGEKIGLISNLSTMLISGISLLETIDSLLEDSRGNLKKVLEVIREDMAQGKYLYVSFSQFPNIFDEVTVNIIHAAEEAGTLDQTLKDLREYLTKEMEFSDKVKNALIYPLVIACVFFSVLFLILIFVIPKISQVFLRLKVPLPLPTKILIFISNIILHYTIPFLSITAILILGLFYLSRRHKKFFLNILLNLPFISDLARIIDLTRFSRSLSLLLAAGIPITAALSLTKKTVNKEDIARVISSAGESVLSGKRISDALKEAKTIIPVIMIKIIEAGEKSGTLDRSLQEISEHLDYQVSQILTRLLTLMEPLLMVVVGIMVGSMMMAIIAPIYSMIGQVGAR